MCRQFEVCKYWETPLDWQFVAHCIGFFARDGWVAGGGDTYSRITTDVLADSTRRQQHRLKSSWKRFSDSVPRTTFNTVASNSAQKSSIREIVKLFIEPFWAFIEPFWTFIEPFWTFNANFAPEVMVLLRISQTTREMYVISKCLRNCNIPRIKNGRLASTNSKIWINIGRLLKLKFLCMKCVSSSSFGLFTLGVKWEWSRHEIASL